MAPGPTSNAALPALSAEVFRIPLEDSKYIIYAPARRAAFAGNAEVVHLISQLQNGACEGFKGENAALLEMLRALDIVDAGRERTPSAVCRGEPVPVSVTLFLTTACSLRCTYCYASAGNRAEKSMTLDTATRGIDFVMANAATLGSPYCEVGYHGGGEPTMNWSVLTASFDYARERATERKIELRSSVATNGILNDAQVDWIVTHLSGANLSCDGLPEVHDRCRLTVSGKGSSESVLRTLRRFDEARFNYGIRLTVTAENIGRLPESVEFLSSGFRPASIHVEPVYLLGRGAEAASAESDEFIAAYREAAERAARHGRQINFSGARLGTLTNHFCGVSRDSFCLSADGNVTACFEAFEEDNAWAACSSMDDRLRAGRVTFSTRRCSTACVHRRWRDASTAAAVSPNGVAGVIAITSGWPQPGAANSTARRGVT
jgi:uncharacterized protein